MIQLLNKVVSWRYTLLCVLIIGLVLRLGLGFHHRHQVLQSDAALYSSIGHHLANGDGFTRDHAPTAYGNFLYPVLLSLIYRFLGDSNLPVYILQSLVDMSVCLLVFVLARRVTKSRSVGVVAAAIYSIFPGFILSSSLVLTETLSVFLTFLALYVLQNKHNQMKACVLSGVICGLLILIRPAMLLFPFAIVVLLLILFRREGTRLWGRSAALILASYLVVAPWTVRNYFAMDEFVPVSTHGGLTFWAGTIKSSGGTLGSISDPVYWSKRDIPSDPKAVRVSRRDFLRINDLRNTLPTLNEVGQDAKFRQEAIRNIKEAPLQYAGLAVPKVCRLWFHLWPGCKPSRANYAVAALNAALIVLAVVGSLRMREGSFLKWCTLSLAVYVTAVTSIAVGVVRYSYPIFPFIIVLAAYGVCGIIGLVARGDGTKKTEEA